MVPQKREGIYEVQVGVRGVLSEFICVNCADSALKIILFKCNNIPSGISLPAFLLDNVGMHGGFKMAGVDVIRM